MNTLVKALKLCLMNVLWKFTDGVEILREKAKLGAFIKEV